MKTNCENCGKTIVARGGKPKTGVYFCKALPCRAAKERHDRRFARGPEADRVEDRPCSACGIELLSRPWRITDLEEGRWCRRTRCQEARAKVNRARAGHVDLAAVTDELFLDARARGWTHCHECGLEYGVQGFMHPIPDGSRPCEGLGIQAPSMELAGWTWPEQFIKDDPNRLQQRLMTLRANGLRPDEVVPSD